MGEPVEKNRAVHHQTADAAAPMPQFDRNFLPVVPPGPPDETEEQRLVPARMINEVLYCERLLYLEWAQGEFADNEFTVEGRFAHRRADQAGGSLPPVPAATKDEAALDATEGASESDGPGRPYRARSVALSSEKLGITARIDVVEGDATGTVVPIEYKRGEPANCPELVWLPERAQICAQVLLLRDHGYHCDEGAVYFAASRQRVKVAITDELIAATLEAVRRARELAECVEMPPPLIDSPKCNGCSLVGICLPDETNHLRALHGPLADPDVAGDAAPQPTVETPNAPIPFPAMPTEEAPLRRLHPARDDKLPVYVQEQGAKVGLSGERLQIHSRVSTEKVEARIPNTSQLCLFGNVQVSTQALRELMQRGIPVCFFTTGGWLCGRALGLDSKNVELRIAQVRASASSAFCLRFARALVASKIRNSRTMLRRNHTAPEPRLLASMEEMAARAEEADSLGELLGLEGNGARLYFSAFTGMFKAQAPSGEAFDMDGRNRRPPRDPINALLSFAYALLAKEFTLALSAAGVDPMLGFYHQPRFGRPSLALDLMEEFRPILADSVVVTALNNGVFSDADFVRAAGSVALTQPARKKLIQAYERRMDILTKHPVFEYKISYRRVLEVQARLLSRVLLGEIHEYPSFGTR